MPQLFTINRMGDSPHAGFTAFHGIAYRCGKNTADVGKCGDCQQTVQIIDMQARPGGIVYQHPTVRACLLEAGHHRVGPLAAPDNHLNTRISCDWQPCKLHIMRAERYHNFLTCGLCSNARIECSISVMPPIERYCLGHSVCIRLPIPAAGRTAIISGGEAVMWLIAIVLGCFAKY